MVWIRNLFLYLKGFSKHYSSHFIFSGYKVFMSYFNSTRSKRSLKLKQLNVYCYLEQDFHRITMKSYHYKKNLETLMPFYSLNFSKSFYFTAIDTFTHCTLKTQTLQGLTTPFFVLRNTAYYWAISVTVLTVL